MEAQKYATQIVKRLVKAGHVAYFAGGWVRDLVMKHPSADVDIATNALPEKILDLFPNTILVGLAFGVVIVVIEGHQFEVSTFRKDLSYEGGRRPTAIEFTDEKIDASRRDFTINGMFYDPLEDAIIDYVGGVEDIKKGIIRTIGDPQERFVEDRLRMIRAVRFSSRFGFKIDYETEEAIIQNADTLFPAVAMERIWQEFNKMAAFPHLDHAMIELHRLGLLPVILPLLQKVHLTEIKHQVTPFPFFPENCPTILYLMELFPSASLAQQLELCQYLKASGHDMKLVEFIFTMRNLEEQEIQKKEGANLSDWAHQYAHRSSQLCLEVIAARLKRAGESNAFLEKHNKRRQALTKHVERIQMKKPLVSASLLQEAGVPIGKEMGFLLKEAERLTITHDLDDPNAALEKLKESPLWRERKNLQC